MSVRRLYIGTYTRGTESEGIYLAHFDTERGTVEVERAFAAENPSFLALGASGHKLYVVNEVSDFSDAGTGAVSEFAVDDHGALLMERQRSSEGALPCHLALVEGERLIVANYGGANVCVFPLTPEGVIEAPSHIARHEGHGPNARRQSEPHPHQVVAAGGDLVLIPDLGLDRIVCYRLHGGRLDPNDPPWAQVAPGSGPRHCVVFAASRHAYLINELDNTIDVLDLRQATGALAHLQRISTLSPGSSVPSACADIHLSSDGRFLYGSNRGEDTIVVCAVGANGLLEVQGHVSSGGAHPRNFCIDPSGAWLLVANRDSDNIVTFHLDAISGMPTRHGECRVPAPVCVLPA